MSLNIVNSFKVIKPNTFTDDYESNAGWTTVGTLLDVNNIVPNKVGGVAVPGNSDQRVHKDMGILLDDSLWFADIEFIVNNQGGDVENYPCVFTAGTGIPNTASQDLLGVDVFEASGTQRLRAVARDGTSNSFSGQITLALSTQYYLRMERTSLTNFTVSVFSNPGRTTHISGSPQSLTIPATITGLTTIQHTTVDNGISNTANFNLDNVSVTSNEAPP